jgi:hypothetical protein
MGMIRLYTGGVNQGWAGAAIVSERNLQGVTCHSIRCIDMNAFSPINSTMVEQQLYPNFNFSVHGSGDVRFPCAGRQVVLQWKDDHECEKFKKKFRGKLAESNVFIL